MLFLTVPAVFYLVRELSIKDGNSQSGSYENAVVVEEKEMLPVQETSPSVPEEQEELPEPGQKKYVSEILGIGFYYLENQGNQTISIHESGNKVYVNYDSSEPESGQYVEIFAKSPDDTLVEAVEKRLLSGYSEEDCEVYVVDTGMDQYPDTYEKVNIRVAPEWEDMQEFFRLYENCPFRYTQSNGISYFLGDSEHSDKFLFFSIGQYGISASAEGTKGWQDTIEFLD
jgi:hypothetical protein